MSEKEKILKMVAEGKISVDDAEKLIRALNDKSNKKSSHWGNNHMPKKNRQIKSLSGKIIIDIESTKGENVKIKLPLKLAGLAVKMIPKDRLIEVEKDGINIRDILANISDIIDEVDDDIVNINSASGDSVRIYVEKA